MYHFVFKVYDVVEDHACWKMKIESESKIEKFTPYWEEEAIFVNRIVADLYRTKKEPSLTSQKCTFHDRIEKIVPYIVERHYDDNKNFCGHDIVRYNFGDELKFWRPFWIEEAIFFNEDVAKEYVEMIKNVDLSFDYDREQVY